jgi:mono/diheme cytochrome c family protein
MNRAALALASAAAVLAAATAASLSAQPTGSGHEPASPPPPPPYQVRMAAPAGDRLAAGRDGRALFENRCGYCHLAAGMGTNLLTKQQMQMGRPPSMGLLANRTDLNGDYVKAVVRNGKGAMPPQTRVDITDPELDAVASFLERAGK